MRLNGVVGKALVVMAMACLGWFCPAGAEMEDEVLVRHVAVCKDGGAM